MLINCHRRLVFNFYLQTLQKFNSNCNYNFYNTMQPSITSFFKSTKIQSKKRDEADVEDDPSDNDDQSNHNSDSEELRASSESPVVLSRKRPLESDSDDEGNIVTAKNNKRRILSSTESTPVKSRGSPNKGEVNMIVEEEDQKKDMEQEVAKKLQNEESSQPSKKVDSKFGDVENKTPSKAQQLFQPKTAAQSPLFNIDLLVKKKISSGALALHENIGVTWFKALQEEFDKPYFKKLSSFVDGQRKSTTVYPPPEQVFTWTHYHPIRDTRVVILGQDPYHGPNMAHGLSFSVQKGIPVPKSLQNIYKELQNDIPSFKHPGHGNLTGWSKQGVLLLNACLTVNKGLANSHQGKGWETFTDAVISWISKNATNSVVFLLWGRFAQKKTNLIEKRRHQILTAPHPSPLSADQGFFGCKHFSQTNEYFRKQKLPEIDWTAL